MTNKLIYTVPKSVINVLIKVLLVCCTSNLRFFSNSVYYGSHRQVTTGKVNLRTWYWVWAESSVYDFFVSSCINRIYALILHVLSSFSVNTLLEFVFFFKIVLFFNKSSNLVNIFGTKAIIIMFLLLINSFVIVCYLI